MSIRLAMEEGERVCRKYFFAICDDVCLQILSFLDHRSLCRMVSVDKYLGSFNEEFVWRMLSKKRWRCADSALKISGANDWRRAYEIFHVRQRIPRGKCFRAFMYVVTRDIWPLISSFPPPILFHHPLCIRISITKG